MMGRLSLEPRLALCASATVYQLRCRGTLLLLTTGVLTLMGIGGGRETALNSSTSVSSSARSSVKSSPSPQLAWPGNGAFIWGDAVQVGSDGKGDGSSERGMRFRLRWKRSSQPSTRSRLFSVRNHQADGAGEPTHYLRAGPSFYSHGSEGSADECQDPDNAFFLPSVLEAAKYGERKMKPAAEAIYNLLKQCATKRVGQASLWRIVRVSSANRNSLVPMSDTESRTRLAGKSEELGTTLNLSDFVRQLSAVFFNSVVPIFELHTPEERSKKKKKPLHSFSSEMMSCKTKALSGLSAHTVYGTAHLTNALTEEVAAELLKAILKNEFQRRPQSDEAPHSVFEIGKKRVPFPWIIQKNLKKHRLVLITSWQDFLDLCSLMATGKLAGDSSFTLDEELTKRLKKMWPLGRDRVLVTVVVSLSGRALAFPGRVMKVGMQEYNKKVVQDYCESLKKFLYNMSTSTTPAVNPRKQVMEERTLILLPETSGFFNQAFTVTLNELQETDRAPESGEWREQSYD